MSTSKVLGFTLTLSLLVAAWSSGRAAIADLAYQKNTLAELQRAVALAPENVVFRALLAEHLEGVNQDPAPQLAEVTRLNPLESQYWVRRAFRAEVEGKYTEAEALLLKAAEIDHKGSPRWAVMNFYFRRNNDPQFWAWFRKALSMNDSSVEAIFRLAWERSGDNAFITSHIPNRPDLLTSYFFFLAGTDRLAQAGELAARVAVLAPEGAFPALIAYCERFAVAETENALGVWNVLCKRKAVPFKPLNPGSGDIITNADFAVDPISRGFDWHVGLPDGVLFGQSEGNGFRVELTGNQPEECVLLMQPLPLTPGRTYEISWDSRAQGPDTVPGLFWDMSAGPGNNVTGPLPGTGADSHGSLKFEAFGPSGVLRLQYKRPLGSVRARGAVTVSGLRARIIP